jgi:hypothetical protein
MDTHRALGTKGTASVPQSGREKAKKKKKLGNVSANPLEPSQDKDCFLRPVMTHFPFSSSFCLVFSRSAF